MKHTPEPPPRLRWWLIESPHEWVLALVLIYILLRVLP